MLRMEQLVLQYMNKDLKKKFELVLHALDLSNIEHYTPLCSLSDDPLRGELCGCEVSALVNAYEKFIDEYFISKEDVQQVIKDAYKEFGTYTKQQMIEMIGAKDIWFDTECETCGSPTDDFADGYNQRGKEIRDKVNGTIS